MAGAAAAPGGTSRLSYALPVSIAQVSHANTETDTIINLIKQQKIYIYILNPIVPFNFLQQEREQGGKNQVLGIDDSNVGSPRPGHRKIAIGVSCSREELTKFKNFLVLSLYATYHTENSKSVCSDASHGKCL